MCRGRAYVTARAGFTFFTIDPSDHVDDTVTDASAADLGAKFEQLIADGVPGASEWRARYVGKSFAAGDVSVAFDEPTLLRAAAKYGRAVAHTETMARHIAERAALYELELSLGKLAVPNRYTFPRVGPVE